MNIVKGIAKAVTGIFLVGCAIVGALGAASLAADGLHEATGADFMGAGEPLRKAA